MGSKGSAKSNTNTNTSQTQTYAANPLIQNAAGSALGYAQNAAAQPFSLPAQPVAGFTPDQLAAFQNIRNTIGTANPYFDEAHGQFVNSATPVTGQDVNNFYNPMANNVFAQLKNLFGQQMQETTGQLTQAAGGVGADRIAVGQANLANQQDLAAGQTAASLYDKALQSALQTKGLQQNAGYGLEGLGTTQQNSALQGAQSLLGAGGLQQQQTQAELNSPYNLTLQQFAYPFQQGQYLAGITGGLAPSLGGTFTGNAQSQSQAVSQPAQPSIFSQIAGAGLAGLSLYNGLGGLGGFGGGKGTNYATQPLTGSDAYINQSLFPNYPGRAQGGAVNPYSMDQGFADGGMPFDERWPEAGEIKAGSDVMANPVAAADAFRTAFAPNTYGPQLPPGANTPFVPLPRRRPDVSSLPADEGDTEIPYGARPVEGEDTVSNPALTMDDLQLGQGKLPYPNATAMDSGQTFARSPWMALTQAGLGMMAGTSPWAGINIGKGGMEGVKTLEDQRKQAREEVSANQRAQQLFLQAQQELNKYNRVPASTAAELKQRKEIARMPYENMTEYQKAQVEQQKRLYDKQIQQLELEGLKPFKIGTDPNTFMDVYGVRDPKTNRLYKIDPRSGRQVEMSPEEAKKAAAEESTTGEDYLKTLDPGMAAKVRAVAEGRIAPPNPNSRSPQSQALLNHLYRYDPDSDTTVWKSRNETRAAFSKGVEGRAVTSLNTLMGHLEDLRQTADALSKRGWKAGNRVENAVRDQLGGTALADYRVARTAVADELARVFQGAGTVAESEKERWLEALDHASTPEQFRAIMNRLSSLVKSRMSALESQYDRGMNYKPDDEKSITRQGGFLNDESRKKFEGIQVWSRSQNGPQGGQRALDPDDQRALDWANDPANRDDPRAAAIRKRLGGQ